jgi:hypothetical protein
MEVQTLICTMALFLAGVMGPADASPPVTLSCRMSAQSTQVFLIDMDNLSVISATYRSSPPTSLDGVMFKDLPIQVTETKLTWRWVQKAGVRTYELDRNTLELRAVFKNNDGSIASNLLWGCHLAKRQL